MLEVRKQWLAAAFALSLGACASAGAGSNSAYDGVAAAPRDEAAPIIKVENRYIDDMVIYVVNGAARVRLGMVQQLSEGSFIIPPEIIGAGVVRLLAAPVGPGQGFLTDRVQIPAGSRVELRLARDLPHSDYAVF